MANLAFMRTKRFVLMLLAAVLMAVLAAYDAVFRDDASSRWVNARLPHPVPAGGAVISAEVFSIKDQNNIDRRIGFILYEFTNANYLTNGLQVNLSTYFSRVEHLRVEIASGALIYNPGVVNTDLPDTSAQSARIRFFESVGVLSGITSQRVQTQILSGGLISGARVQLTVVGR